MDKQITMEELYQKQMREMQKETNYLRNRVVKLNDELTELREHTDKAMRYMEESIEDIEDAAHSGHAWHKPFSKCNFYRKIFKYMQYRKALRTLSNRQVASPAIYHSHWKIKSIWQLFYIHSVYTIDLFYNALSRSLRLSALYSLIYIVY